MDKFRDLVVRIALGLALFLPLYFVVAALGTKFGLFDWRLGFVELTATWGMTRIAPFVLGVAGIALALAFFTPPRRGVVNAVLALLIPAGALGYGLFVRQQAQSIAPIHDLSTDLLNPPSFSEAVISARASIPEVNGADLLSKRDSAGTSFIEWQGRAYGDIAHVVTSLDRARAFQIAADLADNQDWRIGDLDPSNGVIEAVAETFWFGFKDDIVIRVRSEGSGARIDMRSGSRVGRSDLGANAARMRPFLEALRARVDEVEAQEGPALAPPREGSETDTPAPPPP